MVRCSFQPSGARDKSSHRPGGEAMAAAAHPGSSLEAVLGACDASRARGALSRQRERRADAEGSVPDDCALLCFCLKGQKRREDTKRANK